MRCARILLACLIFSSASSSVPADSMSDAFGQGQSIGSGAINGAFAGINTTTEQTNIPSFGASTSTQSGYYGNGDGNIETPGAAEISTCANAAPSSNPMANQYCNAVNFLATNPSFRPQMAISQNDPLLQNTRAISQNANTILQSNGISTTGATSQCVPATITTPAQYTTEMCTTAQGLTTTQCVMGRVVNITDNTNYQCNQTVNAYQTQTCNKVLTVAVTALSQCSQTGVIYSGAAACASACATMRTAVVFQSRTPSCENCAHKVWSTGYAISPGYNPAVPTYELGSQLWSYSQATIETTIASGGTLTYRNYNSDNAQYPPRAIFNEEWAAPSTCTDVSTTTNSWSDQCATLEAESQ